MRLLKDVRRLALGVLVTGLVSAGAMFSPTSASAEVVPSPGHLEEGDVVYQVLVDRFENGDETNDDFGDGAFDPNDLGFYHGGDWNGLASRLPYIANLGVTAIWISPVSKQEPVSKDGNEASYHGYFTKDFATPNEHFGSREELQNLIYSAHALGLKMILDVVPNHTADYLDAYATTYTSRSYQPTPPLNDGNLYHHRGDCLFNGLESQEQIENCDLGGLDDLDQSNPLVSRFLIDTYKDWVSMGFDGIRVDAARSIPKSWLREFEQEMGVPTFGEVFVGDIDYVSEYQGPQWGVLDFPYFFAVRDAFAADGDMRSLSSLFAQDYKYENANRLETFIDNHDRARFLTWADDNYQRLRSALAFEMSSRGVPVIYYGTEQADDGNGNGSEVPIANKDNRKDMTQFDENAPIYKHIQRLANIKKNHPALKTGKQLEMWVDTNVYAFTRIETDSGDETITVSSNSWDSQTRHIPIRAESNLQVGTQLRNLLNTGTVVEVQAGGPTGREIIVNLGEHETAIFAAGELDSEYSPEARTVTKIRVHFDTGLGNNLTVRGSDYPLSWVSSRAMRNVAPDVWEFEIERLEPGQRFEFKPMLNDEIWSAGDNYVGLGGQTIDVYPHFQ